MNPSVKSKISRFFPDAKFDYPFAKLTTFRAGGPASVLIDVAAEFQLRDLLALIADESLESLCIGRGSNLLISDLGFDGVVFRLTGALAQIEFKGDRGIAGAGASLVEFARAAAKQGLSGLEFAGGIPGSVGGAVYMNAGAHGSDISCAVSEIRVVSPGGETETIGKEAVNWDYRQGLQDSRIISTTIFKFFSETIDRITKKMDNYLNLRKESQPAGYSAGSVFRNPPGEKAWQLIKDAGFMGMKIGGASVSDKHANFIMSDGTAAGGDIYCLIRAVQKGVMEKTGIELIPEIRLIGKFEE
ncbi:MAG: UDP-N-acetylenolpyruvoylglucosamine reductase [Spirochaetes bacterium GWF1_51_8]|nr:MAG: UDP-N-acetylenolpyruvoylglucosamine reductase [Spirochaetes bacterium GWF1_51_8]